MAPQALFNVRTSLAVLGEVLNGTNHLRGVGVLVVVPRHDLNLIGVVVATLNFHDFFVIVHNFETTVTVPQHTVVVPKPACSYQDYTTFRRYFQVLSQFYVLELSYSLYFFLCTYIFMWLSVPLLGASGTRGFRRGVRPAQMRSSAACFAEISPEVILRDGVRNRAIFVWYKTYMPYDPTVASISNRIHSLQLSNPSIICGYAWEANSIYFWLIISPCTPLLAILSISTWNHAGCNAPWQAETGWGEKVKPRKPAWNQAFLWLPICGCQARNKKKFTKK